MLVLKSLTLEEKIKCYADGYDTKNSQNKCPKINVPKYLHVIFQLVIDVYK
jgi:hypothetical protein